MPDRLPEFCPRCSASAILKRPASATLRLFPNGHSDVVGFVPVKHVRSTRIDRARIPALASIGRSFGEAQLQLIDLIPVRNSRETQELEETEISTARPDVRPESLKP
jgi:hypothetical protein